MIGKKYSWFYLSTLLLLLPQSAMAHLVSTRFGEFYSGVLHPLSTLTHLLPWLAVGLVSGLQCQSTARKVLLYFPLSVSLGVLLGSWFSPLPITDALNLLSFSMALLAVLTINLRPGIFISLLVLFGLSHGYANGVTDLRGSDLLLYVGGVTVAAYFLLALITAITYVLANGQPWGKVAVRAVGSWIVAIGLLYGGFTLFT